MATKLSLIAHASTDALRRGAVAADEPLDRFGERDCARAHGKLRRFNHAWVAPELRARQTAEALGIAGHSEAALRDLDCGSWRGQGIAAVAPEALAAWLKDPDATPHGGESIRALLKRVSDWLGQRSGDGGHAVAVTHPQVIRAAILHAIDADTRSFQRIDVAPLDVAVLSFSDRWRFRSLGPLVEPADG